MRTIPFRMVEPMTCFIYNGMAHKKYRINLHEKGVHGKARAFNAYNASTQALVEIPEDAEVSFLPGSITDYLGGEKRLGGKLILQVQSSLVDDEGRDVMFIYATGTGICHLADIQRVPTREPVLHH